MESLSDICASAASFVGQDEGRGAPHFAGGRVLRDGVADDLINHGRNSIYNHWKGDAVFMEKGHGCVVLEDASQVGHRELARKAS